MFLIKHSSLPATSPTAVQQPMSQQAASQQVLPVQGTLPLEGQGTRYPKQLSEMFFPYCIWFPGILRESESSPHKQSED